MFALKLSAESSNLTGSQTTYICWLTSIQTTIYRRLQEALKVRQVELSEMSLANIWRNFTLSQFCGLVLIM